jgi:hypothetical protein
VLVGCPSNYPPTDNCFVVRATADPKEYEAWLKDWRPVIDKFFSELEERIEKEEEESKAKD